MGRVSKADAGADAIRARNGGLLAYAQALTRGEGKPPPNPAAAAKPPEEGAAAPPPPAAAPAAPPPPADPLPAFRKRVQGTLDRIAAAARSPVMKGDAYREVFVAQAAVVELLAEFAPLLLAAREALPAEERAALVADVLGKVEAGTAATMKRESRRWFRGFDRRTTVLVAGMVAAGFVIGWLLGFATGFRVAL